MAQLIEAGTYQAKAVEGALGETKGGKEQAAVRFQLIDFDPPQFITWYGHFTDKTLESTFRALRTAGWRGQELSDLSDLARPDVPVVHLVVEHETGQDDVVRAKVRWVNSAGGMGLKAALPADKAKAFAARMKGALAAFDKASGAPAAPKTAPAAARPAAPKPPAARPTTADVPQEVLDAQASGADGGEPLPF